MNVREHRHRVVKYAHSKIRGGGILKQITLQKLCALGLLALIVSSAGCDDDEFCPIVVNPTPVGEDVGVIWQGMEHAWTYNHRWEKFGGGVLQRDDWSFLGLPFTFPSGTYARAMAQTGIGPDTANQTIRFTEIHSNYVGFHEATWTTRLLGEEFGGTLAGGGDEIRSVPRPGEVVISKTIVIDAPLGFNQDRVFVVLNGFWLEVDESTSEAKKIEHLQVRLDNANIVTTATTIEIPIVVSAQMDCDTNECNHCSADGTGDPTLVDYDLMVSVTALTGAWDTFRTLEQTEVSSETWDGPDDCLLTPAWLQGQCWNVDPGACGPSRLTTGPFIEYFPTDAVRAIDFNQSCLPVFSAGTVGITGFSMELDGPNGTDHGEYHMLEFGLGALAPSYTSSNGGRVNFEERTYFKNWRKHMGNFYSGFSIGESGSFTFDVDYALIAFYEADIFLDDRTFAGLDGEDSVLITEATGQ